MATLRRGYRKLVERWDLIVAMPLDRDERRAACYKALREYVFGLADGCLGKPDPAMAFHAVMLVLRDDLRGVGIDDLRSLAILPSHQLVSDWLMRHEMVGYVAPHARELHLVGDIPASHRLP